MSNTNIFEMLEKAEMIAAHLPEYEREYEQYARRTMKYIECNYGAAIDALHITATKLDKVFNLRNFDKCIKVDGCRVKFRHPASAFHIICDYNNNSRRYFYIYVNEYRDIENLKPWELDKDFQAIMQSIEKTIEHITLLFETCLKQ